MSIKRKLTWMMMAISLAAVLLTVGSITIYLIYDMRQGKEQELSVTAALSGDRNSATLAFLDNQRAESNLQIFRMNPAMLIACLYNKQGSLFAAYAADGQDMRCPKTANEVRPALPGALTSTSPIRQNGDSIGSVYLVSNTSEIDAYVHKIILISATVASLVLSVTLLLTVYFQRSISQPILRLAGTARAVTESRNYSLKADESSPDETGLLARTFNAMLGEVQKRDRELLRANETLEQKVLDRTFQLQQAKAKAEAASEAKGEFLRNMSHEFRTPLHAIMSFSAYGIKEYETGERAQLKQYFDMMLKASERLCRLVNEVLDLAKLEHGEYEFNMQKSDLRELIGRSAEMMQSLLNEKTLVLTLPPSVPVPVVCDQDKLVQVITNLLSNAIKFTPSGKRIAVTIEAHGEGSGREVALAVCDEGVGIPEGETQSIFDSFKQSSRTNTGAGGTGLGLAICRNIIAAHGGRIWAENNQPAPGAKLTFVLPEVTEGKRVISLPKEANHGYAA